MTSTELMQQLAWITSFHTHNLYLPSRTILFSYGRDTEVGLDEELAAQTIRNLHILESLGLEDIQLVINNEGGSVAHGFAVYGAILRCPCTVTGTVLGQCLSMGVWVLQACDYRLMEKHAELMIHNGTGDKNEWDRKQDRVCETILLKRIREKNPGFQRAHLKRLLEKDTSLTAAEALKLGLVDEVI